ncbi:hypothetical protein Tco_0840689 [Tanacetum coccineum]|uniref:Uncharacterized protein n=1 Tax=Tanacetum coccineum TaxID=301880 RepID=A0ABQ5AWR5_9ASTR
MPWRHPDSCITNKVPTSFNQNHVDRLKAHIVKLYDIPKGVLVRSGLSRVWRNPMSDRVLRRSDNTVMSIYDFLCMPSLDKVTVREEPHGLDTSILGRVDDRTTSPAPAGTAIPCASLEEIAITRPDCKVVTKADHAAKLKASTGLEISTNAAKKTRSSKKGSRAGSSGLAVGDEIEQTDDGTLDDDDQRDGSDFATEDIGNLNDIRKSKLMLSCLGAILLLDKEVKAHAKLSGGVRRATRASFLRVSCDVNVDPYYEARVSNTAGDMLERYVLPFVLGPYYIPYPYDEGSGSLHSARFPTPVETYRLRELSLVELSNRISVLQYQLIIHGSMLNTHYDHSLRNDKKHRKYRNERDTLAMEKAKIKEELVGTKFLKTGEFNRVFAGVLNTTISVRVKHGLHMDRTDEEFRELSQRVDGFIPDAKEKFDRVVAAFPATTFLFLDKVSQNTQSSLQDIARLEPDRVMPPHQTSSATASLRANTHVRHSTSSSRTFGHTRTPEHLKKKKKSVEKGGPLAA